MDLGSLKVTPLTDGLFRLDGGAMFGIIPKHIWERSNPSDEKNRILLGMRPLLVESAGKKVLINTGIGNKFDEKFNSIFQIDHQKTDLIRCLDENGIKPSDIDTVLLTHLHLDHTGWNTIIEGNTLVPTFKNAKYIVQKGEWDNACNANERTTGSYIRDNFLPLEESGQLEIIESDSEIMPKIRVEVSGGHTKFHQMVFLEGDKTGLFWSDIMPTISHLKYPYIMGYDLYPIQTLEMKKKYAPVCAERNFVCFWEHDPQISHGHIEKDDKRFKITPL